MIRVTIRGQVALLLFVAAMGTIVPAEQADVPPPTQSARPNVEHCRQLASRKGLESLAAPCETALSIASKLPDFVCDQITHRSMPRAGNLDTGVPLIARDVVTAEVRYVGGRESYSNIKVNGKASKAGILGQVGLSTNGEFGTILQNLFDKESGAEFKFLKEEGSAGVFEFRVGVDKSKWIIGSSKRMMRIPYHGRIWVDKATNRIVRIEQRAELDGRFSFSGNIVRVDYGEVRLGDRGTFQLPLKSESTACLRGQQQSCFVNEVVFQNCRKFTVNSRIVEAEESPTTTPQVTPQ